MDEPKRSGLQQARQDRGWTQEEAADQLARLAWMRRGERVGVNADMIAKWERGDKGISPAIANCSACSTEPHPNTSASPEPAAATPARRSTATLPRARNAGLSMPSAEPPPSSISSVPQAASCGRGCSTRGRTM